MRLFKSLCAIALLVPSVTFAGEKKDIVDTAIAAGSFKTLATALQAADLVGALKGEGPFPSPLWGEDQGQYC